MHKVSQQVIVLAVYTTGIDTTTMQKLYAHFRMVAPLKFLQHGTFPSTDPSGCARKLLH
jgi:hypothetical protein